MSFKNPSDNPCWRGYHPVGTKMQDGKEVPNCVPIEERVLPGGKSEGMSIDDIAKRHNTDVETVKKEIKKGIKVELEHITNKQVAAEIARDHVVEDLHYYEKLAKIDETDEYCPQCLAEYLTEHCNKLEEAEYRGRKVTLGKPFLTPGGPKKRSVYVKNAKGNVVKVNFGDPNMKIKKNIPARRKSFRARHHCDTPGPRWKARYWSCKAW